MSFFRLPAEEFNELKDEYDSMPPPWTPSSNSPSQESRKVNKWPHSKENAKPYLTKSKKQEQPLSNKSEEEKLLKPEESLQKPQESPLKPEEHHLKVSMLWPARLNQRESPSKQQGSYLKPQEPFSQPPESPLKPKESLQKAQEGESLLTTPQGSFLKSKELFLKPKKLLLKPQKLLLKPQGGSYLKPQESPTKPQKSFLKPQVSLLKPQISHSNSQESLSKSQESQINTIKKSASKLDVKSNIYEWPKPIGYRGNSLKYYGSLDPKQVSSEEDSSDEEIDVVGFPELKEEEEAEKEDSDVESDQYIASAMVSAMNSAINSASDSKDDKDSKDNKENKNDKDNNDSTDIKNNKDIQVGKENKVNEPFIVDSDTRAAYRMIIKPDPFPYEDLAPIWESVSSWLDLETGEPKENEEPDTEPKENEEPDTEPKEPEENEEPDVKYQWQNFDNFDVYPWPDFDTEQDDDANHQEYPLQDLNNGPYDTNQEYFNNEQDGEANEEYEQDMEADNNSNEDNVEDSDEEFVEEEFVDDSDEDYKYPDDASDYDSDNYWYSEEDGEVNMWDHAQQPVDYCMKIMRIVKSKISRLLALERIVARL